MQEEILVYFFDAEILPYLVAVDIVQRVRKA